MAASAELGHRQQGGGFRISWEVGKNSKTGPGLGTGKGGQAPGSQGSGSGGKNGLLSREPCRLVGAWSVQ